MARPFLVSVAGRGVRMGRQEHELYNTWRNMIRRCHDPKDKDYRLYGAKGIRVCNAWRSSMDAFLSDMGPRPSKGHTLDRIDATGNYEPGNVRWATVLEQQRNRTNNRRHPMGGRALTAPEWAEELGLPVKLVQDRLKRGWTVEKIASQGIAPTPRYEFTASDRALAGAVVRAKFALTGAAADARDARERDRGERNRRKAGRKARLSCPCGVAGHYEATCPNKGN
jgi:hypothetical protein